MAWDNGRERSSRNIRMRTTFTKEQLEVMEREFAKNDHPDMSVRERISKKLNLTTTQVSIWFKNRRARAKKNDHEDRPHRPMAGSEDDDGSEDSNSSPLDESTSSSGIPIPSLASHMQVNQVAHLPFIQNGSVSAYMSPPQLQQPPQPVPQLVTPPKQDTLPGQQGNPLMSQQEAASPFRFVPNPPGPIGVISGAQANLPVSFHQTAYAVIPAQQFATMYSQQQNPHHQNIPAVQNPTVPPPLPSVVKPDVQAPQGLNFMPQMYQPQPNPIGHSLVNGHQQSGYQAEREFFGDKYVIQPYLRNEYTGGLQPIHYATDEDGPPCY